MVALLVVMAVVLILVAKAWRSVAPEAMETHDALQSGPLSDHGQEEAAGALRSGELPKLGETRRETDEHSARVQEALDATE
jgi:hypothetical protein